MIVQHQYPFDMQPQKESESSIGLIILPFVLILGSIAIYYIINNYQQKESIAESKRKNQIFKNIKK